MFPFPLFRNFSWLKIAFYICILVVIIYFIKEWKNIWGGLQCKKCEGFTQSTDFVLKSDANIYDPFYCEIYDKIHLTEKRASAIIGALNLDDESTVLDIGCGTGYLVKELRSRGISATGIDKSEAMISVGGNSDYVRLQDAVGDNQFYGDHANTFSHILCLYGTVYEIGRDKRPFFRNVYYALRPDGTFVVELQDDTPPLGGIGQPKALTQDDLDSLGKSVKKYKVDFGDFSYLRDFSDIATLKEKFVDSKTGFVRENEFNRHIEPSKNIVGIAKECGFFLYSRADNLYFFKKAHEKQFLS